MPYRVASLMLVLLEKYVILLAILCKIQYPAGPPGLPPRLAWGPPQCRQPAL